MAPIVCAPLETPELGRLLLYQLPGPVPTTSTLAWSSVRASKCLLLCMPGAPPLYCVMSHSIWIVGAGRFSCTVKSSTLVNSQSLQVKRVGGPFRGFFQVKPGDQPWADASVGLHYKAEFVGGAHLNHRISEVMVV